MRRVLAVLAMVSCTVCGEVSGQTSPYVGQQTREIKALSAQDIDDLLNARGMALAKAAELNGYPGPAHLLESATELKLTVEQVRFITEIKNRLEAAAKPLGAQIVARERELDRQFASGRILDSQIAGQAEAIGTLQGRLRSLHLAAHLTTKEKLTAEQIVRYNALRGYGPTSAPQTRDPAKRHGG